jgi:hypothetical protein
MPTAARRRADHRPPQAIIDASVQDDMYNEAGDPSVNTLQDRFAEITGKEAALWCPSGTMGNQICLRTHLVQPPHAVLLDHRAHVHSWESGALPVMSQATTTQVVPANGLHLTVDDVRRSMVADGNSAFFHLVSCLRPDELMLVCNSPFPAHPRCFARKYPQRNDPPSQACARDLRACAQLPRARGHEARRHASGRRAALRRGHRRRGRHQGLLRVFRQREHMPVQGAGRADGKHYPRLEEVHRADQVLQEDVRRRDKAGKLAKQYQPVDHMC